MSGDGISLKMAEIVKVDLLNVNCTSVKDQD